MSDRGFRKFISQGVVCATVLFFCGCDRGATNSAAPATLATDPTPPESTLYITLIMPAERSRLMDAYEQDALMLAGEEHAMFQLERPEKGASATRQVELIEKAVADGSSVILILPQDPKIIAPALEAARESGVSVVVLNHPVEGAGGPFTLATQPPIEESARPMVDAVLAAVKKSKLSEHGPAVLAVNRDSVNSVADARTEGLRKALNAAGVSEVIMLDYAAKETSNKELYRQAMERSPRPSMILAADDTVVRALADARRSDAEHNRKAPILGGLGSTRGSFSAVRGGQVAAVVDMRAQPLVKQAMRTAIAQFRGEPIQQPVVVKRAVLVTPELDGD
jgi:ABC-type sugar transport system substrate-binding protein